MLNRSSLSTLRTTMSFKTSSWNTMLSRLPNTTKGVSCALISTALFVIVGIFVRQLSETIDLFQVLLFRQVVFIILLLPSIKNNLPQLLKPQRVGVHLSRVTGAFIALYFGFVAVSHLPLADATALGFLQVLFVAVMSKALLSEKLDRLRMSTIALGFVGVIMVVQPSFSQASSYYVSLGVLSAFGAAIAVICVRTLSQNQPKVVLLSYQAFFVGLVALIPSILSWQTPTLFELTLLVLIGVTSSLAQWIGVSATNRPCQHRRQCRVLKNAILHPIRLLAV